MFLGLCFAVVQAGVIDLTGGHDSESDHEIQHDFGADFGGHDGYGLLGGHGDSKEEGHVRIINPFFSAVPILQ